LSFSYSTILKLRGKEISEAEARLCRPSPLR